MKLQTHIKLQFVVAAIAACCINSIAAVPKTSPGHGYPGKIEPYAGTPELKAGMERFGLTSGWFRRAPLPPANVYRFNPKKCPANELPYLLFSPKRDRKPVPMVLYFGGNGEHEIGRAHV